MSEVLSSLNSEARANDVINANTLQPKQYHLLASQAGSVYVLPRTACSNTGGQLEPFAASNAPALSITTGTSASADIGASVSTATISSTPVSIPLSTVVSAATQPVNGVYPDAVTTDNMYKVTPAPIFMTPSLYPQVAVIPEGDLLRSMIVQDVKQVTDKLLERQGKSKRGRRNRKERVVHGEYGTLKVNFRKFFREQPPMTQVESVPPKRTVYQRIAPRYSTTCTDTTNTLPTTPILDKNSLNSDLKSLPNKKKSGRTKKLVEPVANKSDADVKTQRRTYKSSKLKSSSKPKDASSSTYPCSRVPQWSQIEQVPGFQVTNSDETGVESVENTQSCPRTSAESSLGSMSMDEYIKTMAGGINSETTLSTGSHLSIAAGDNCNDLVSSSHSSSSNLDTNPTYVSVNDMLSGFTESITNLVSVCSSSGLHLRGASDSSPLLPGNDDVIINADVAQHNGIVASCQNGMFAAGSCMSSTSGNDIGSEFNFLSDLCTDFPSLCSDELFDKMEIGPGSEEMLFQSEIASSSLASFQATSMPDSVVDSQSLTPVSKLPSHDTTTSSFHSKTGVVPDSSLSCTFDNNPLSNATESLQRCQAAVTSHNSEIQIGMDTCEASRSNSESRDLQEPNNLVDVIDISPEFASTQGGGKIILIGSWNNKSARYSCRFGDVSVPADLIQNGVLRCYCPVYRAGKVKVAVLSDGTLLSKQVNFEYVDTEDSDKAMDSCKHDWLTISDDHLKQLLIQRIDALCGIFDSPVNASLLRGQSACLGSELEDVLTKVCESLSAIRSALIVNCDSNGGSNGDKVMTVLHLSSALGFTKLIQVLCNWVETNRNAIIAREANPRKQDQFMLTPLMWACAKGKFDTVCVLLQWDESTAQQIDGCGCTPLSISKDQGHKILERYLERWQSKGYGGKRSSLLSDNGSPLLQIRGRLSRSSSLSSQFDHARDPFATNGDNSPDSSNSAFPSRTLGQTLAYVQAIMQEGVNDNGDENSLNNSVTNHDIDDNESLFVPSPFTPRTQNSSFDDVRHGAQTPRSSMSSLSPGSPGHGSSVQSPFDPSLKDTAEFCEFFYNSERFLERDFAELTLTDEEQQNLYKAATVIQNAYKDYRERRKQRDSEFSAAVLIQSYYRRYKQYAMFKKMQKGAMIIQHKYRAHREKERQKSHAASVIQTYYRRYKERKQTPRNNGTTVTDVQQRSKALQQADRKVNRFRAQTNSRNRDSWSDPDANLCDM